MRRLKWTAVGFTIAATVLSPTGSAYADEAATSTPAMSASADWNLDECGDYSLYNWNANKVYDRILTNSPPDNHWLADNRQPVWHIQSCG